jgi:cytidine deaminase
METLKISANIIKCLYNDLNSDEKLWIDEAKKAAGRAYSPYSGFSVGAAAVLEDGQIITGNNQENVAFPSGLCAERTTVFYANSRYPDFSVKALAIAAYTNGDFTDKPISPCGSCRQVLLETELRYNNPIKIYLYGKQAIYIVEKVKDLLPLAFDSL